MQQAANHYVPANVTVNERAVWDRLNFLLTEVAQAKQALEVTNRQAAPAAELAGLKVQLQAVTDRLTTGSTFVGAQDTTFTQVGAQSVAGGGVGFALGGTTAAVVLTVTSAATARTALGLGTLATKNSATAVAAVTGTAGATYGATEQTLINDLKTALNSLLANLLAAGVTV